MTYIYVHFFSNGDKYVGISNNPERRWKEGFDSNNSRQYNHKVLIANEKYDRLSMVISEDLPRRIAETMEASLITNLSHVFNLNIKNEIMPNLHGNNIICIYTENFSHVYPQIDGEILYYSSKIEENNNHKIKEAIDYNSIFDNYNKLLSKAIEQKQWDDVKKYSDEILYSEFENPDAIFYKELSECWINPIDEHNTGYNIINAFDYAINILKKKNYDEIGKKIELYSNEILTLINYIKTTAKEAFEELLGNFSAHDMMVARKHYYIGILFLCEALITQIINFNNIYSKEVNKTSVSNFDEKILNYLKLKDSILFSILNLYESSGPIDKSAVSSAKIENLEEIRKYEPNYVPEKSGGWCYIATSVYGSYDCPEVWTLRRFRDNNLSKLLYGRIFIKLYYNFSPTLVKYCGDKELFKRIFKSRLDKFVEKLQKEGIESTHYIDK